MHHDCSIGQEECGIGLKGRLVNQLLPGASTRFVVTGERGALSLCAWSDG